MRPLILELRVGTEALLFVTGLAVDSEESALDAARQWLGARARLESPHVEELPAHEEKPPMDVWYVIAKFEAT